MAERGTANWRLIIAVSGVGLAFGTWIAIGPEAKAPDARSKTLEGTAPGSTPSHSRVDSGSRAPGNSPYDPLERPVPDYQIEEGGRLSIDAQALREGAVVTLGLALADEARGDEPLSVRVVSVDGRVLDLSAAPTDAEGGGVQLAIEADWLRPGDYMIQIKTIEKTSFPLRRYVLEVR